MKKTFFKSAALLLSFLFLQACSVMGDSLPTVKEIKAMAEDFSSYLPVREGTRQELAFPPDGCLSYKYYKQGVDAGKVQPDPIYEQAMKSFDWKRYADLSESIHAGEINRREIYKGLADARLILYATPRYGFTEEDIKGMERCTEGEGYLPFFRIVGEHILWADTDCTGRSDYTESEAPGITRAKEECPKVRDELLKYKNTP